MKQIAADRTPLRAWIKLRFVPFHDSIADSLRSKGRLAVRALYLHIRIIGHFFYVAILVVFFAPIATLLTLRLDAAIQTLQTLLASLNLRMPSAPQGALHYQLTVILQLTLGLLIVYLMTLILAVSNTGSRIWANPRAYIFQNSASNSLLRTSCFVICYATLLLLAQSFEYAIGYFSLLILTLTTALVAQMAWEVRDLFCEIYDRTSITALATFAQAWSSQTRCLVLEVQTNCTDLLVGRLLQPSTDSVRATLGACLHFMNVQRLQFKTIPRMIKPSATAARPFASLLPGVYVFQTFPAARVAGSTLDPYSYTLDQLEISFLRQNLSARAPPECARPMTPGGGYTFGLFLGTECLGVVGSRKSYRFRPGDMKGVQCAEEHSSTNFEIFSVFPSSIS